LTNIFIDRGQIHGHTTSGGLVATMSDDTNDTESDRVTDLREMLDEVDSPGAREMMEVYGSGSEYERRKERYLSAGESEGVVVVNQ